MTKEGAIVVAIWQLAIHLAPDLSGLCAAAFGILGTVGASVVGTPQEAKVRAGDDTVSRMLALAIDIHLQMETAKEPDA